MSLFEIDYHPTRRQLRVFGIASAFVLSLAGWWFVRHSSDWGWPLATGLWLGAAFALLWPAALRRVYVGSMIVTWPLGLVVSWVVLAVVFYGVFTPVGLILRWLGHDALGLRFDREAPTYWTPRQLPANQERYFRQF